MFPCLPYRVIYRSFVVVDVVIRNTICDQEIESLSYRRLSARQTETLMDCAKSRHRLLCNCGSERLNECCSWGNACDTDVEITSEQKMKDMGMGWVARRSMCSLAAAMAPRCDLGLFQKLYTTLLCIEVNLICMRGSEKRENQPGKINAFLRPGKSSSSARLKFMAVVVSAPRSFHCTWTVTVK